MTFQQQLNTKTETCRWLTSPRSTIRNVNKPPLDLARSETKILVCNAAVNRILYTADIFIHMIYMKTSQQLH